MGARRLSLLVMLALCVRAVVTAQNFGSSNASTTMGRTMNALTSLDDTDSSVDTSTPTTTTTATTIATPVRMTNTSSSTTRSPTTTTRSPITTTRTPATTTTTPSETLETTTPTPEAPTPTPEVPTTSEETRNATPTTNTETPAPPTEAPTAAAVAAPPSDSSQSTSSPTPDSSSTTSEYGTKAPNGPDSQMTGKTESSGSSAPSSWIVPVVVATVVLMALLVIVVYVRAHKRDDNDELDRQSDAFFEAPRSNTNNYANAAGTNNGMVGGVSAVERAQKEVVMSMRKESTATAVPPVVPHLSSKMRSDSVTNAPPQTRNRQDSTPIMAEPAFTLQRQVELEQSQSSVRMKDVPRSPQAMTSPISQSFEPGSSLDAGQSYDLVRPISSPSVTGVTL